MDKTTVSGTVDGSSILPGATKPNTGKGFMKKTNFYWKLVFSIIVKETFDTKGIDIETLEVASDFKIFVLTKGGKADR